jgi:carbamoyltransferase
MYILGLNHGEINSSAALYHNGKIIAAAPEERFNRIKRSKSFPKQSVQFCLDFAGIKLKDVDYIVQAWYPGAGWIKYNPILSGNRIKREDYFYTVPDNLFNLTDRTDQDWIMMSLDNDGLPPIYYIKHHRTHAANAFYLSPFEEAAILTCDFRGEFETTTMGFGKGNEIKTLEKMFIPHSLGVLYSSFTELLGYQVDGDEWKVMALSAFDVDCSFHLEKIKSTFKLLDNGLLELDLNYYKAAILDQPNLYTEKLVKLLGGRVGIAGEEPDHWHYSIARAMQIVFEEIAIHMLLNLYERTKLKNVVLGGGSFMNSVFNGKVIENTPFENVYISHSPSDVGNSIGAALYVAHNLKNEDRNTTFSSSYLGPSFSDEEIQKTLERRKIEYEKIEDIPKTVADILSRGEIIARFNGRMEFGERALGNRSILADPRAENIKDKINSIIKYREGYRPFAPVITQEKVSNYFDVSEIFTCNYMEKVVQIKKEFHKELPAVTHVDGSGRVQTVSEKHNLSFYQIIKEFELLTGLPIVLNTSFNIAGEPVVLSPDDALSTFYNSGLEYLMIGGFLVKK